MHLGNLSPMSLRGRVISCMGKRRTELRPGPTRKCLTAPPGEPLRAPSPVCPARPSARARGGGVFVFFNEGAIFRPAVDDVRPFARARSRPAHGPPRRRSGSSAGSFSTVVFCRAAPRSSPSSCSYLSRPLLSPRGTAGWRAMEKKSGRRWPGACPPSKNRAFFH